MAKIVVLVIRMSTLQNHSDILFSNIYREHRILVERGHWGDPEADGRAILIWILRKWEGVETGWSWLRRGTGGGHL